MDRFLIDARRVRVLSKVIAIASLAVGPCASAAQLDFAQQAAYDKLVQAANSVAIEVYAHENSSKVGGSGPSDPFSDLLQVKLVVQEIDECQAGVAAALAAGIPGSTPVEFITQGSSLTSPTALAAMSSEVCGKYRLLAEATLSGKRQEAQNELARFLNALAGDRRRVFNEVGMHKRAVKGPGGGDLLQPDDFARASAWYTFGIVADSFPKRWYVHGWVFDGDSLVSENNSEGVGNNPPSSVFSRP
jgi:hypothetical protein